MCSESGAYGGHDEYMMSHDDYEQEMDDYNYEHDMGDFYHDNDASCMKDMADHRYHDNDVEHYTDYTSTSIIDEVERHTNYENFDSLSTIDMNHYYNYDTASLDDMMEP